MRTRLAVMLGVACLAPALSAAQELPGKSDAVAQWVALNEGPLQEQLFPIAAAPGEVRANEYVRCRVVGTGGQGPVLYELADYGRGRVVLKTRTLAAPDWATAVVAVAPGKIPRDVGAVAARIDVAETEREGKDCPELFALVAQIDTLRLPATAPYFTAHPGTLVACQFQSLGLTSVRVSVAILDADEPWKPFLDWVKRLSSACPKK